MTLARMDAAAMTWDLLSPFTTVRHLNSARPYTNQPVSQTTPDIATALRWMLLSDSSCILDLTDFIPRDFIPRDFIPRDFIPRDT
jgi:hypothetical protein